MSKPLKINTRTVIAATPNWDAELKGFGIAVQPTGVKSFCYQYRTPEGRRRRIAIGHYPEWQPDQAREKAEDFRQLVRAGGDPLGAKQALKESLTISDVLDAYLVSEDFTANSPLTQKYDRGRIERHLRPLLGKRHAHLLTVSDVKKAHAAIRDGKTAADVKTGKRGRAIVRGGDGAAREAIVRLGVILNWAIRSKLVTENPVKNLKLGSSGTRNVILDDTKAYGRLFQTLDRMEQEHRLRPAVADAIRLVALTGARRGEIAGLRWRHVELDKGRLVLPPESHKTGRKNGKVREIALPAAAQVIIARQPEGEPDAFVFPPTRGDGGPLELSKLFAKVRAEGKLPAKIGLHGLRHSLASHMAMGGSTAPEIMEQLGHKQMSTTVRYLHWAADARTALAEKAASVVVAGMAAGRGAARAKVVKLKRSR
jgi:integrase